MNSNPTSVKHAGITAIGAYVPERVLANDDLARIVDTNDEWIVQRTGIRERRICAPDQYTSDLCVAAVENMLSRYPVTVDDVDLILVATHTPDYPFPSVACLVQAHFGIRAAGTIDMNATCADRKVLVIGADNMSRITDYTDRTTCILFGDGAGAVLVEKTASEPAFLAAHQGSDGSGGGLIYRTGIRSDMSGKPLHDSRLLVQNGREVYKWAVQTVPRGMHALLEKAERPMESVDWFIPHSANLRMIESICEKSGYPIDRTLTSMVLFGNTSAASIPLSMAEAAASGRIKAGNTIMLYGFGGGLTHAGLLVRWTV
ncbi:MAG: fabHB [Paenibacillus sp.]|nr:fabHB [Paenibacillus sp.]